MNIYVRIKFTREPARAIQLLRSIIYLIIVVGPIYHPPVFISCFGVVQSMITRVLVPMDGSELSERALRYALEAHPDAALTVLHVVGGPSSMMGGAVAIALADDPEAEAEEHSKEVFDRAHEIAAASDREITTETSIGSPMKTIVRRAGDFDTVVVGSHGSDVVGRLFVGNVAEAVVRRSPVPVTVVR